MSKEIFILTIKDGQAFFNNRGHWESWVQIQKPGQYVLRQPTSLTDIRGINQNNLYWKRNQEISDKTGYTKEEVHEYIMYMTGNFYESTIFGEIIPCRTSSTQLNKTEFSKLFDKQKDIADQYNDGLPEEAQIKLTTTGEET